MPRPEARVEAVEAAAYTIPTEPPESDGTLAWTATTLVVVEVRAGGTLGIGYTYAHASASSVVRQTLAPIVRGADALTPRAAWDAMLREVRNAGRPGLVACAISAVDVALWDLKAKLLDLPLVDLLGAVRDAVPVYGSGGFTSDDPERVAAQLATWVEAGCAMVKMKIGRGSEAEDVARMSAARAAIGERVQLFVDANGAYRVSDARRMARVLDELGVRWLEEPVSSDDLEGLRRVRDGAPGGVAIAAGEYGYDPWYFDRMLAAGSVDVLQVDATRACGITGLVAAAHLAEAKHVPLSAHTAPALHLHACCALRPVVHLEHFDDHVRIEQRLFDGVVPLAHGALRPDRSRPGLGIELKRADAARYRVRSDA